VLKLRLRRTGATKQPHYRIVVAESSASRDGSFVDVVGHYHPLVHPADTVVDETKALHWLTRGAQPTKVVQKLLTKAGVWEKFQTRSPQA
jgi:small subunit ribosomal protein S16